MALAADQRVDVCVFIISFTSSALEVCTDCFVFVSLEIGF